MYQTSDGFAERILSDSRTFLADIRIEGESLGADIRTLNYRGGSNAGESITLGSAVSACVELTIYKPSVILQDKEIQVFLGMDTGEAEWIPLGYFTVQKPVADGEDVKITAYDRMYRLEKAYFSGLTYPASTDDMLQEISELTGVPVTLPDHNVTFPEKPDGYTARETVSYIAQLLGCFAIVNRDGELEFRWYQEIDYPISQSRYWPPFDRAELDYSLNKLECTIGKEEVDGTTQNRTLTAGAGIRGISISNPFMTKTILNEVYDRIKGFQYRPGSLTALGDPRLEPGDIVTVNDGTTDHVLPIMTLSFDWDGGLSMDLEAVGNTETEETFNAQGPTARALDRTYTELFLVNKIVANKIDAEYVEANFIKTAEIEGVKAEFEALKSDNAEFQNAVAENLSTTNLQVENLSGELAEFKTAVADDFTATNAKITTLTGDFAEFETAVTGDFSAVNATIKDLQAADATLQNAVIGKADVTDLDAAKADIALLKSDVSDIDTLIFGSASGTSIQTSFSNAVIAQVGDAQITSAMIRDVSADKITAGDIITNNVRILSEDGSLLIADETMQISDGTRVRVQIGKDAAGDYSINIWDADGNLMFSEGGLTDSAIKDAIIRDDMVSETANISGYKLNVDSLFEVINGSSNTIKSSQILVDDENQTLSVAFKAMTTTVEETSSVASSALSVANDAQTAATNAQTAADKAQADIDGLEVGGRNYVLKSDTVTSATRSTSNASCKYNVSTAIAELSDDSSFTLSFDIVGADMSSDLHIDAYMRDGTITASEPLYWMLHPGDEYERVSKVITLDSIHTLSDIKYVYIRIYNGTGTITVKNVKLEKGNRPTDWSPAPEDVESDIAAAQSTADSANALAAENSALITTLTSTVTSQGTTLNVLQGQIESKIWQEDITTEINKIEVGGRNLVTGTSDEYVSITLGQYYTRPGVLYTSDLVEKYGLTDGDEITFSIYLKSEGIKSLSARLQKWNSDNDRTNVCSDMIIPAGGEGRSSVTMTFDSSYTRYDLCIQNVDTTDDSSETIYYKCVKLERGNKPTDWTPAPEDVESEITTLNTQYTELSQDLDSISATVAKHTTQIANKADGTTVTELSNQVSEIELSLDGFKSTVESDYATKTEVSIVQTNLDNLEIGGRNLALNTAKFFEGYTPGTIGNGTSSVVIKADASVPSGYYRAWTIPYKSTTNSGIYFTHTPLIGSLGKMIEGETYTVSFWAKASVSGYSFSVRWSESQTHVASSSTTLSTTWQKYWMTFKWTTTTKMTSCFYIENAEVVTLYLSSYKLELGNRATDWSPAPEDVSSDISEVQSNVDSLATTVEEVYATKSELTQTSNSITASVSETYATKTALATTNANVTTAQNTANTAKTNAATAQSTANTAKTNAATAQTAADKANTNLLYLTGDQTNYSQLNTDTASLWGFSYDSTADGRWFTVKTLARDTWVSNFYECSGGEKLKITYEISTSVKGASTSGGSDSVYLNSQIGIYGFDEAGTSKVISYASSVTATADAPATAVSSTVTVPTAARKFRVFLQCNGWAPFSGTLKIRNLRVSKIDAVESRVTTAETKITQNSNSITSLATRTTNVENKFDNYSTTKEMTSAIEQKADSITSTVSSTYATKSALATTNANVATAQETADAAKKQLYHSAGGTTGTAGYVAFAQIKITNTYVNRPIYFLLRNRGNATASELYVQFVNASSTDPSLNSIRKTGGINIWIAKIDTSTWYLIAQKSEGYDTIYVNDFAKDGNNLTVSWINVHYTSLPTSNITAASQLVGTELKSTIATKTEITQLDDKITANVTEISELGTRTTAVELEAGKIAWLVKSGTSSSDFALTDRTATLVANYINLNGLVEFSGLGSDAQEQITTAQSTADTAVSNAASAQSTANTANARATYHYGTCSTAAATAAKVVTCSNFPALYTGATVWVKFTYANSAASPTLNVNSKGAKAIYAYGAALTASSAYNWVAGALVQFIYNGSQWVLADSAGLSKANTALSTANTAKTNAAAAQSTADAVTATVDAGADNWDSAYAWTSANGSNMSNLLAMVKTWTNDAISTSTYINGGWIDTSTITADKIAIGDFTNYATVNENLESSMLPSTFKYGGTQIYATSSYTWIRGSVTNQQYLCMCNFTANSFKAGDVLRFQFIGYVVTAQTVKPTIFFYDADRTYLGASQASVSAMSGAHAYDSTVTISSIPSGTTYYIVGFQFSNYASGQANYVTQVSITKISGRLQVGTGYIDSTGEFQIGPMRSRGDYNDDVLFEKAVWIRYGLELLGANDNATPYIDFHYGETDDSNANDFSARIVNTGDSYITFYGKSAGDSANPAGCTIYAQSVSQGSDRRLKDNIVSLDETEAEDFLMALKPSSYTYKNDPAKLHHGLIYDEVQEATSAYNWDLFTKVYLGQKGETEYGGLCYMELTADIISVLQKVNRRVKSQEQELPQLQGQVDLITQLYYNLQEQIAELQAQLAVSG